MDDEEVGFTTASELREAERSEASSGNTSDAASDGTAPTFAIEHPAREHRRSGGMRYEGGTVFALTPAAADDLATAVVAVLDTGPYRYGDWFDLPMPLFLVHDDGTNDTFRVAVRDGTVELHVRSATTPSGLRAFHDRLVDRLDCSVAVERTE